MTNMTWMQAPEALAPSDLDPIDLLVPPPRSFGRSLLMGGVAILIFVGIVAASSTGLVRPRVGLAPNASYTAASSTSKPSLSFNVRNDGSFPVSIVAMDARQSGLGASKVTVAILGPYGQLGRSVGPPSQIRSGRTVHITMTFATWNCHEIALHGSTAVPIHLAGPFGLDTTVSMVPGYHFDPPNAGIIVGMPDPNEIGWAAGITWTSCHPGGTAPNVAAIGR